MSDLKRNLRKTVTVELCLTQCVGVGSNGVATPGFEPLVIEEETTGSLYQVDPNTHIVAFDSYLDGQKVTTTAKLSHGVLSLVRIGEVHTRQTFAVNEWYASQYFYDGGSIVCRNYTKKLDYALSADGGLIDVLYELWSGDSHLGYFNLELFIR